jgi:benzoyl-CoA reductase/2-hydroxyglutaryl-CoA dehydratase subunit BcrC/BadD/HgdB
MKWRMPVGLVDRLALQISVLDLLPVPLLGPVGGLMRSLHLFPEGQAGGAEAFMAPHVREASAVFMKMLAKWIRDAKHASREGRKVILVPFNFPCEVVHAFDNACPLTSEVLSTLGASALPGQGEEYWDMAMGLGLPDHLCSANTIELGSMLGSDDFEPQAIISAAPGGCDVNAKIHEFVAHYLNIPQFFLPKIPEDSGRGRKLYNVYMHKLIAELEKFLGEKLTEDKLRRVLTKANRCTELYLELWDLHKAVPCPVPNLFSILMYGTRFTMWGTDEGIKTLETMVRVAKERLAQKLYPAEKEIARCIWVYTSYYFDFLGFFNWMEERGYTHIGDGLDLCFPQIVDLSTRDSMIEGLAEAAWNMPMTRQVGGESMSRSWTEDVIWAAKELNADCAIYCGHHSCKQTWSVVSILRSELAKRTGIPLLILQGDAWIKRMTPMSVIQQEIDEFIRNVVSKKTAKPKGIRDRLKSQTAAVQQ